MTFPLPLPRLKVQHLIDWLEPQLQSEVTIIPGRLPVSNPSRAVGIIPQPGRGFEQEGEIDNPVYLFQCRGGTDNFSDAEDIAYEVDSLILAAPTNFDIAENVTVDLINRAGGAPTASPITDAQNRWTFSCSYVVRVSTGLYLY